ncbi:MAG: strawberry notch family protein [Pseudomonadota bacterium]
MNRPTRLDTTTATPVATETQRVPTRMLLSRLVCEIEYAITPGTRLSKPWLRTLFEDEFGEAEGPQSWTWRLVQDCVETAIARYSIACPCKALEDAYAFDAVLPVASHRSEHQLRLQQFSTPPSVAFLATRAAASAPGMQILEPSAGTGLLAGAAQRPERRIIANELDPVRATLCGIALGTDITRHDAIRIGDLIARPVDRVILNPPFRTSERRQRKRDEWADHLASAWTALKPGGRLVALLPAKAFEAGEQDPRLPRGAGLRAAITLPRDAFRPSGTSVPIRMVVLDQTSSQHAQPRQAESLEDALAMLVDLPDSAPAEAEPPNRPTIPLRVARQTGLRPLKNKKRTIPVRRTSVEASLALASGPFNAAQPVSYCAAQDGPAAPADGMYQPWQRRIAVDGADAHPTPLVVSAAMAAIRPAVPDIPVSLPNHVLRDGLLSDAQAETLVLAEAAFARDLPGRYIADPATGAIITAPEGEGRAYRQGFFLGDGTGVGKGRQVASLFLAARASGAVKGVWISKSDTLIQDAKRDWTALRGAASEIIAQSAWKPRDPITALAGIIFTTYATLRQEGRGDAPSRLDQLTDWLGEDFDGIVAFDEAHAMANALAAKGETAIGECQSRRKKGPRAGAKLDHWRD